MIVCGTALAAQSQTTPENAALQRLLEVGLHAEPSGETATVVFFNRPIVVLRARVLGRGPAERALSSNRLMEDLISGGEAHQVETRVLEGAALVMAGGRTVLVLTPPDVDELSGETLDQAAAGAARRLQQALDEAYEARTPARLLRSAAVALAVMLTGALLAFAVARSHRAVSARLVDLAETTVTKSGIADANLLRASRLGEFQRRLTSYIAVVLYLLISYSVIAIILRQFPFTRPWGESMRGFLFDTGINVGLGIARSIPGLVTIAIIVFLTRFIVRLIGLWFHAIDQGSIAGPRWLHPETAQPTRRLLTAAAWLFAIVLIFPYVPGSQTDAFKGVSVLVGLIVTLGSSGLMNQLMSNFMITYSRALRVGDFVRIGEVEGTVMHLGMLSTKIHTVFGEEVTIPNAVVIAQTTTDFSRMVGEGVLTRTSVTIGYDSPWRQVHSLLLTAATRTPGIRKEVKPFVFQASLRDFYVEYTLAFALERQDQRVNTLAALHANIQDLFNEYGVQIMSPHYLGDPAAPKVVPADKWFAAPAHAKEVSTR